TARHIRLRIAGEEAEQAEPQHALARTRLADEPDDLPGPDVERDATQRPQRASAPLERDVQVAHGDKRIRSRLCELTRLHAGAGSGTYLDAHRAHRVLPVVIRSWRP